MLQLKNGALLLVVLALVSCRNSIPPEITICLGDGLGGANCILPGGKRVYKLPSELEDFWMTTNEDMAKFSAWCYDTSLENVTRTLQVKKKEIKDSQ